MKFLVIVESPAKKTKIESYLNTIKAHNFIVDASYGHICEFSDGLKSIDIENNFNPSYKISDSKKKVVSNLLSLTKKVDEIIIATDLDREGEAIGYHLIKTLKQNINTTKRIVFNEITKSAIVNSFNNPTVLNMDMFFSQQARSILDLLIGYNISPLLWSKVREKLSAGRCQSPALRLIYDREMDITKFKPENSYHITSNFNIIDSIDNISTKYYKILDTKDNIESKLINLFDLDYKLVKAGVKNKSQSPSNPYITSTIQQDASVRFGLSPENTMNILQKLHI